LDGHKRTTALAVGRAEKTTAEFEEEKKVSVIEIFEGAIEIISVRAS
jgi:hypothetical protein